MFPQNCVSAREALEASGEYGTACHRSSAKYDWDQVSVDWDGLRGCETKSTAAEPADSPIENWIRLSIAPR